MFEIYDEHGNLINTEVVEYIEQKIGENLIQPSDVILELGARYGSVSCRMNYKLKDKTKHIAVEPDSRVWDALERNRNNHNCQFEILKGFISRKKLSLTNTTDDEYATTSIEDVNSNIQSFTLEEVKTKYTINKFTALIVDCEGFLEVFLDENPELLDEIRIIMFEADYPDKCDYKKIRSTLFMKGFIQVLHGFQNVWVRE